MSIKPRYSRYLKIAIFFAIIMVFAILVLFVFRAAPYAEINMDSDKKIAVTPQQITEIKKLGQWEFLSVVYEEVIDTVRHNRLFSDDRLTCIYYGNVRLGIDLTNVSSEWAKCVVDTVYLTLPNPRILDKAFIDETRTQIFYENGRWTPVAKEQMYRKAAKKMAAEAMSPSNIKSVREAATQRFISLFEALGAKHVEVNFDDVRSDEFAF